MTTETLEERWGPKAAEEHIRKSTEKVAKQEKEDCEKAEPFSTLKHARAAGDEEFVISTHGIDYEVKLLGDESRLRVPMGEFLTAVYQLGVFASLQRPMHKRGESAPWFEDVTGGTICFVPKGR